MFGFVWVFALVWVRIGIDCSGSVFLGGLVCCVLGVFALGLGLVWWFGFEF